MVFYLTLTLIWLGAALIMLLWPGGRLATFPGFNPGWVALALAAYNLVRWFSVWAMRASRQKETAALQASLERHQPAPPTRQSNPAFDFGGDSSAVSDSPNSRRDTSV